MKKEVVFKVDEFKVNVEFSEENLLAITKSYDLAKRVGFSKIAISLNTINAKYGINKNINVKDVELILSTEGFMHIEFNDSFNDELYKSSEKIFTLDEKIQRVEYATSYKYAVTENTAYVFANNHGKGIDKVKSTFNGEDSFLTDEGDEILTSFVKELQLDFK